MQDGTFDLLRLASHRPAIAHRDCPSCLTGACPVGEVYAWSVSAGLSERRLSLYIFYCYSLERVSECERVLCRVAACASVTPVACCLWSAPSAVLRHQPQRRQQQQSGGGIDRHSERVPARQVQKGSISRCGRAGYQPSQNSPKSLSFSFSILFAWVLRIQRRSDCIFYCSLL